MAFFAPSTSSFQKLLALSETVSAARFAAPLVASNGLFPAQIGIRAARDGRAARGGAGTPGTPRTMPAKATQCAMAAK
jgi:hypothetical protein